MLNRHDIDMRERSLDACIDRLVSGGDWQAALPTDPDARRDVLGLVAVASRLVEVAGRQITPAVEMKRRVWERISTDAELATGPGFFRRLAGFRVLYFPPQNPSLVHRLLFARVPGVPPLFVRFAEAS